MKRKGRLLAAVLAVSLAVAAGGCQIGGEKVTISRGMSDNEVFLIGGKSCKLPVMKLLLVNNMNLHGESYGIDLLNNEDLKVQKKFGQYVKKICMDEAAKVYTMDALADQKGITLNDDQKELVQWAAEDCYQSMSEAEISALSLSQDDIVDIYGKYALADKLYAALIADVNQEVSDDEARVMEIRQILVPDKEQADQAYAELQQDTEFSTVAANYTQADEITLTIERGMLPQEAETVVFAMDNGTYSEPVQTTDGYYIFYCDNKYDEEQTQRHKQDIIEQRRQEAFDSQYDPFVEQVNSKLNEKVWKNLSLQDLEQYSFGQFYEIYDKYFGEEDWIDEPVTPQT